MNSQLSPRDWEYLSAYLDRQLKPKEVSSLEARLSTDPVLSAALGELQRTRDALRNLPKLRAPRNFTLTPQMVGQRSPLRSRPSTRLAPVFGFASAVATFLLVLVVIGDLLGIFTPSSKPVAQAPLRTFATAVASPAAKQPGEGSITSQAPLSLQAQQPAPTPTENQGLAQAPQALQAQQAVTNTNELTMTIQSAEPFSMSVAATTALPGVEAGTETITGVYSATITAKTATGMGGIMGSESSENMAMSEATLTPEGLQWKSTISVTVSPTETLTFPMTITMEGPGITATFDTGLGGGQPEIEIGPTEPAATPVPEESPAPPLSAAPTETPSAVAPAATAVPTGTPEPVAPLPTEAPGLVAQAVTPLAPSPAEPQLRGQAESPAQQPARSNQAAVRTIEVVLALLALVSGITALTVWLAKRL